jgi:hypothetical protein
MCKERWQELCDQAIDNQDLETLIRFMEEQNRLLDEHGTRARTIPAEQSSEK